VKQAVSETVLQDVDVPGGHVEALADGSDVLGVPWPALRGALVSVSVAFGVPVLRSASPEETAELIHSQGGIVMAPHPGWSEPPSRDLLRRHRGAIDCFETLSGPASTARAGLGEEAARLTQRFGILSTAGSGATTVEDIGAAHLRMRSFTSAREFLDALVDAEPVQRRRGLRTRTQRERRRPAGPAN
jgi:predicted metal-dependent phosphoesterase TrpH